VSAITATGTLPPFQRFLDSHRDAVWRFLASSLARADAEDCFQETFIAALRAYPRLRADSNLRAWVLTIAHRKALDVHRARGRRAVPVADPAAMDGARAPASPTACHSASSRVSGHAALGGGAALSRGSGPSRHRARSTSSMSKARLSLMCSSPLST
jgi:DNA-directed RNA polymerase specialized sigma24 family protein